MNGEDESMQKARTWFFFIGTEAELIKVFPVIIEARKRGIEYHIIASGQNDITSSRILKELDCGEVELELSRESEIKKSAAGLMSWWAKTYRGAGKKIRERFSGCDFTKAYMIVHGDTVSTYMGARIGKKLGMTVGHIEAGLRSHHLLTPFPEEIDRLLTSRTARMHFAPGDEAASNLKKARGTVVNTEQNTLLDSLRYSREIPVASDIGEILGKDYFVFVLHRQENLAAKEFVSGVVGESERAAEKKTCVFILHEITQNALAKFGLLERLKANPKVILHKRVDYFDFMKLLDGAAFVITDGGSNQEELYYMNKPCLILRKATERNEGIGINCRLFNGDPKDIRTFIDGLGEQADERRTPVTGEPSKKIADTLEAV